MDGSISEYVKNRLPSSLRNLDETHQKAFIYLRLRKGEDDIARLLNTSNSQTSKIINEVKRTLITSGQLYLIENPRFIPIQTGAPDDDLQGIPLPANELDIDKKLIIKEFLSFLRDAVIELPAHQAHILRLRYQHNLSAKEIVAFSKRINLMLIPGKSIEDATEQDVFYSLNKALKSVLKRLKERYIGECPMNIDTLKDAFELIEL
ncbi:MAG TPA: hypothetical protein VMW42_11825 [Desulfatiglandales bacterium]|nr:hypothetical protein [Desulfatiglandales bacterium]